MTQGDDTGGQTPCVLGAPAPGHTGLLGRGNHTLQLKQKGYNKGWTQIVDVMDTQHSVATEMKNLQGDTIHIEKPTEPTELVREICELVGISPVPYKTKKSVGVQISEQKKEGKENQGVIEPDISNTG